MRLIGLVAVMAVLLFLGLKAFSSSAKSPLHSPAAAQSVVNQARGDLSRNEAQGQQQVQHALNQVPTQ